MTRFSLIFELPTFANLVHNIHVAFTSHLAIIFTLKIVKEEEEEELTSLKI